MKRRNFDNAKMRRTLKKSRMSEGFCSSSLIYLKILFVWAFVMMVDFLLDFRFEYFWPSWLLLRSIYDSFRYQGVAFSVFFVCVTVTSDMICFIFIPVQWLFFLAGTCVWVQYVWHADRGVCLPTVTLWLLFIYVEASVRLKELKTLPFTLDICRPFAAHCIGYPVVTLGFGVKTFVSYRLRWRKQREVAKENEIYAQLLREALPVEQHHRVTDGSSELDQQKYITSGLTAEDVISHDLTRCSSVSSALYNPSALYGSGAGASMVAPPSSSPFLANFFNNGGSSNLLSGHQNTTQTGLNNNNNSNSTNILSSSSSRLTKNFNTVNNNIAVVSNGGTGNSNHFMVDSVSQCGGGVSSFNNFYNNNRSSAYQRTTTASSGAYAKSENNGTLAVTKRRRSSSLASRQKTDKGYGSPSCGTLDDVATMEKSLAAGYSIPLVDWFYCAFCKFLGLSLGSGGGDGSSTQQQQQPHDGGTSPVYDYCRSSSHLLSLPWSTTTTTGGPPPYDSLDGLVAAGATAQRSSRDSDDESRASKESADGGGGCGGGTSSSQQRGLLLPSRGGGGRATSAVVTTAKQRKRSGAVAAATSNFVLGAAAGAATVVPNSSMTLQAQVVSGSTKDVNSFNATQQNKVQDKDLCAHLEIDLEKLRNELRLAKSREQELRRQVNELTNADKTSRSELQQLKQQYDQLQTKFQNLIKARQQDKENVSTLEKRVCEEQKLKIQLEQQLKQEKKQQQKKLEEAVSQATGKAASINAANPKNECTEMCKQRRRDLENQLKQVRRDVQQRDDKMTQLEQEVAALRQYKESNNIDVIVSALNVEQEKNQHLELSLSAETRIKLDLFSALGDAKRQLEITTAHKKAKEQELDEMRMRLSQLTTANNALLYNGQSGGQQQQQQSQLTPPSSATPSVGMDHQPAYDVMTQQLYNSPYNMTSMNGLMFDDCVISYHHSNLPFVPINGSVGGTSDQQQQQQQQVSANMRYSPPRSSAAK